MSTTKTHQPSRVIAGHCPECNNVVVVFNNYEVWPLVVCECGWAGGTTEVAHHTRLERGGLIFDAFNPVPGGPS